MKKVVNDLMVLSLEAQVVHWKTGNYAAHIATEELYEGLRKYTDDLVEALRSTEELDEIIPDTLSMDFNLSLESFIKHLENDLNSLEGLSEYNKGIQNIIDDICTLFRVQLYKLTYLS